MKDLDAARLPWRYLGGISLSLACTGTGLLLHPPLSLTNVALLYVLGAAIAGLQLGRAAAALTALLNVALFNYCFVPPRFSFAVADGQYLVTFGAMLAVALVVAQLVDTGRAHARQVAEEARRTALLLALSRGLLAARDQQSLRATACAQIEAVFGAPAQLLLPDEGGRLCAPQATPTLVEAAQAVFDDAAPGAPGIALRAAGEWLLLPLRASTHRLGVLAVAAGGVAAAAGQVVERRELLEGFGTQVALALERARFADAAEAARIASESEKLRSTLLASISHDVRTPLAVITSASSTLADPRLSLDAAARDALVRTIEARARDVSGLVTNVLELMRLESAPLRLRRDWEDLADLTGAALARVQEPLARHPVEIALPADLPLVHVDAGLATQLIANLLENAARHTPQGTRIRVHAEAQPGVLWVHVDDAGPGLPPGPAEALFAKFHRGRTGPAGGGAGLGLAICRAIVEAHGGRISATNRVPQGARFSFTLPREAGT
jgi:two-component system sensor histidine kinase KdpD